MAYANFQGLIDSLHSGVSDTIDEAKNIIEINEKRQFVPKDFDTVIAYEGDINCQIITFKNIRYFDAHDLSACQNHEIRWKNLTSGIEGTSKLSIAAEYVTETSFCAAWEVPPELCTQAGTIEISIAYYDKDGEVVVFSWNTGNYTGLSVGKSMDSVGFQFPAKNEILVISKESKSIVAPVGYNNILCNFGDVGIANVYFLVDRYLGKNNDLDTYNSKISIYIIINGHRLKEVSESTPTRITRQLYTSEIAEREKDGLVFIKWEVPSNITANESYGSGKIQIAIEFQEVDKDGTITKRWFSNPYSNLEINKSILEISIVPGEGATTEDVIYNIIDNYFEVNDIVFEDE